MNPIHCIREASMILIMIYNKCGQVLLLFEDIVKQLIFVKSMEKMGF
jgi:hypothetical protein